MITNINKEYFKDLAAKSLMDLIILHDIENETNENKIKRRLKRKINILLLLDKANSLITFAHKHVLIYTNPNRNRDLIEKLYINSLSNSKVSREFLKQLKNYLDESAVSYKDLNDVLLSTCLLDDHNNLKMADYNDKIEALRDKNTYNGDYSSLSQSFVLVYKAKEYMKQKQGK